MWASNKLIYSPGRTRGQKPGFYVNISWRHDNLLKAISSNSFSPCQQPTEFLGRVEPGNQEAIAALTHLLDTTEDDNYVRYQAAVSLGKLDRNNSDRFYFWRSYPRMK